MWFSVEEEDGEGEHAIMNDGLGLLSGKGSRATYSSGLFSASHKPLNVMWEGAEPSPVHSNTSLHASSVLSAVTYQMTIGEDRGCWVLH